MLLGSLPVILAIIPAVLGAVFHLQAQRHPDSSARLNAAGNVSLLIAVISVPIGTLLFIHDIQVIMDDHYDDLTDETSDWYRDDQEMEILEIVAKAEARRDEKQRRTDWRLQPCWVRFVLVVGSLAASASVYGLSGALGKPVVKFDLNSSIRVDLNNNVLNLFLWPGWVALGATSISIICLMGVSLWSSSRMVGWSSEGDSHLRPMVA